MAKTLYAPLNGVSDKAKKILVSTGGLSNYVVKGYCSVGGLSKLFFNSEKKAETIIYYSDNNTQYVYDESSGTWNNKAWGGNLKPIEGYNVWTDGTNIYYSNFDEQYVLDESTDTWNIKTWNGFTPERGYNIWSDGDNVYYSNSSSQYVLNKSTSTWSIKTWNFAPEAGSNIWTDGTNIYYSYNNSQYVLDKSTSTWSIKTWNGFTMLLGQYIWTDGTNIYYSNGYPHYILNKETNTWSEVTFNILGSAFSGTQIWSDGDNVYYSDSSSQFVLNKTTRTWNAKTWGTLYPNDGMKVWKYKYVTVKNYYEEYGENCIQSYIKGCWEMPVYVHKGSFTLKRRYTNSTGEHVETIDVNLPSDAVVVNRTLSAPSYIVFQLSVYFLTQPSVTPKSVCYWFDKNTYTTGKNNIIYYMWILQPTQYTWETDIKSNKKTAIGEADPLYANWELGYIAFDGVHS